jgi:hypothetical protein
VKIWSMLPDVSIGECDQPVWTVSKKNTDTCSDALRLGMLLE